VQAWLVADDAFVRRYGLGAVKPFPFPLTGWQANGYLQSADTWCDLARRCGIDAEALGLTVQAYNLMALRGVDEEFGKGETAYNRIQGDAAMSAERGWPNPCMAPLVRAPFHAVRVVPGSLGTFAGLQTDTDARVLDGQGRAVAGLFAVGNDKHSVFAGHYPSGGITLGPALTFGWLAGRAAAKRL
jgi:succinate dehydrogenase/fumarate reductase flavoprotein subunit